MKHYILLLCFLVAGKLVTAQSDTAGFRAISAKIQRTFAPDKRTVFYEAVFKRDSVLVESSSAAAIQALRAELRNFKGIQLATTLLPTAYMNGLVYGVANLSVCNNRAHPSHSAEMLTQMTLGTPVEVLKKREGFYMIRTPDGYLSWVDGSSLGLMDKPGFEKWKKAEKIIFTADYGHAFSAADISSARVSDLVSGNILQLLADEGSFYKVSYPDKRVGYIPKKEAMLYQDWIKRPNPGAAQIITTARSMVGTPYLWGGTSVKGMDCSGFTKTTYFLNGIIIPRDASQQVLVGTAVDIMENDTLHIAKSLRNLLPGDLLFFSAAKRRGVLNGRITHTAIYMGNGEFIQAAGLVRINSFLPKAVNYDSAQSLTLVGARRMLPAIGTKEITRVAEHPFYKASN